MEYKFINEEILDLSITKHMRSVGDFTCGADHPLNDFLYSFASEYMKNNYGKTYLLFFEEEILAYYTLKAGSVIITDTETVAIPLVEIARLAVSYDFQAQRLGKTIFYDYILPKVENVSSVIAIYGIMVFVLPFEKNGIKFYKGIGFIKADDNV